MTSFGTRCCRATARTGSSAPRAAAASSRASAPRSRIRDSPSIRGEPRCASSSSKTENSFRSRSRACEATALSSARGRAAGRAPRPAAVRRVPLTVRSVGLGPRAPRIAVRVRLRVGHLPPSREAALRLLRAADPLSRPLRRPHRAEDRPFRRACAGSRALVAVWWEDGFAPRRVDGFVDAMRDALRAYLRFAAADRLEWAPHLSRDKRLFLTRP